MYYIAYRQGIVLADGEAADTAHALAAVPGEWQHATSLGDESRYVDPAQPGTAVYVRTERAGIHTCPDVACATCAAQRYRAGIDT